MPERIDAGVALKHPMQVTAFVELAQQAEKRPRP